MLGGKDDTRASVYQRLAALENAGIPLLESVHKVVEAGGAGSTMLGDVQTGLNAGLDPGEAFIQAESITSIEGRLVAAASRSGSLPEVFRQLADMNQDRAKTVRYTVYSLIYPAILLHAAIFLPALPTLFMDANQGGGVDSFLAETLLPLGILYGLGFGARFGYQFLRAGSPVQTDAVLLRVPVVGGLIRKQALATSLQVLRTFYANGVPILEALEAAAEACPNQSVARQFDRMPERVGSGDSLAAAFALEDEIPPIVTEMVQTGETTGELDHMLEKAEQQLKESANQTRGFLIAAVGIGAFLLVAGLIAFRVISFYANLYGQMSNF